MKKNGVNCHPRKSKGCVSCIALNTWPPGELVQVIILLEMEPHCCWSCVNAEGERGNNYCDGSVRRCKQPLVVGIAAGVHSANLGQCLICARVILAGNRMKTPRPPFIRKERPSL